MPNAVRMEPWRRLEFLAPAWRGGEPLLGRFEVSGGDVVGAAALESYLALTPTLRRRPTISDAAPTITNTAIRIMPSEMFAPVKATPPPPLPPAAPAPPPPPPPLSPTTSVTPISTSAGETQSPPTPLTVIVCLPSEASAGIVTWRLNWPCASVWPWAI